MRKRIFILVLVFISQLQVGRSQYWHGFSVGFNENQTDGLCVFNNELYACGGMLHSGATVLNSVTKWDGSNWQPMANGSYFGAPVTFAAHNNELFAGGRYHYMYGFPDTRCIAKWDGTSWFNLDSGITDYSDVAAMTSYNGSLYVGGDFQHANNIYMRCIAKWDSAWHPIGVGLSGGLSQIYSMAVYNNELYVGGYFSSIDGVTAYDMAKFNGTTWSQVGYGANGDVICMYVDTNTNRLYAAGNFDMMDSVICQSNTAYFDGSSWHSIGNATTLWPRAITVYKNKVYVGLTNRFPQVGADTLNNIAYWDGTYWQNPGSGANCSVFALTVFNDELVVGGCFDTIGGNPINRIAAWVDTTTSVQQDSEPTTQITIFPNPVKDELIISSSMFVENKNAQLKIFDVYGKEVLAQTLTTPNCKLRTANLKQGVYFVKVTTDRGGVVRKFVKE
jgi:hypothetical protein